MRIKKYFLNLFLFLSFNASISKGSDTILQGNSISGNQTITSQNGTFELGFFTPGNSQNYYLGIWYKNLKKQTIVWVANRKHPVSDPFSSSLNLLENGNLVLLNQFKTTIWSTNSITNFINSTAAKLFDNGNFVVEIKNTRNSFFLWQSFDYPTDTWLPGGKIGYNKLRNEKQVLFSWKTPENPAPGIFSFEIAQNETACVLIWNESEVYLRFSSIIPELILNYITNLTYVLNENESYFSYADSSESHFSRFKLDFTGQLKEYTWDKDFGQWKMLWMRPLEQCQVHAFCGANSICNQQKVSLCDCLKGFEPKMKKDWNLGDYSSGCVRKTRLECSKAKNDTFLVISNIQNPKNFEPSAAGSIEQCRLECLRNCSCSGYVYENQCLIFKGDLFDLQQLLPNEKISKVLFHVRIAATSKKYTALIVVGLVVGFLALGVVLLLVFRRRRRKLSTYDMEYSLVLFKYKELKKATNNFSETLGEGSFGTVFKGKLPNSEAIAVKKLKGINHDDKQFRMEIRTIGMIQHINLVCLKGFCAEDSKRFLVYDYMPNHSLESVLFGNNSNILEWKTRYQIAIGTAKGLAYLHDECIDCIIHCDIKPENILLDKDYNAKVADFGLAKLVGRDFSRVLTTLKGTRGYLAPEWIAGDPITPKVDVYSYGKLLFEIISGRRNMDHPWDEMDNYFPYLVANEVSRGKEVMGFLDCRLEGYGNVEEVNRACKVACWCIQDDETERPTMRHVVQILEGVREVAVPPMPQLLRRLAEASVEASFYQETTTSSLFASTLELQMK